MVPSEMPAKSPRMERYSGSVPLEKTAAGSLRRLPV
jgi:hypothetical protein